MSRQRYVKVECDQCSKTEYLIYAAVSGQLKMLGWFTETDGKDLCGAACLSAYKSAAVTEE